MRTRRCESWSCRNSFTIVVAAGVTVHSQSACAFEFLIFASSAVKLVVVGAKMTVSVIVKPYASRERLDLPDAVASEAAVVAHQRDPPDA